MSSDSDESIVAARPDPKTPGKQSAQKSQGAQPRLPNGMGADDISRVLRTAHPGAHIIIEWSYKTGARHTYTWKGVLKRRWCDDGCVIDFFPDLPEFLPRDGGSTLWPSEEDLAESIIKSVRVRNPRQLITEAPSATLDLRDVQTLRTNIPIQPLMREPAPAVDPHPLIAEVTVEPPARKRHRDQAEDPLDEWDDPWVYNFLDTQAGHKTALRELCPDLRIPLYADDAVSFLTPHFFFASVRQPNPPDFEAELRRCTRDDILFTTASHRKIRRDIDALTTILSQNFKYCPVPCTKVEWRPYYRTIALIASKLLQVAADDNISDRFLEDFEKGYVDGRLNLGELWHKAIGTITTKTEKPPMKDDTKLITDAVAAGIQRGFEVHKIDRQPQPPRQQQPYTHRWGGGYRGGRGRRGERR